jgi:hypothetical protein
MAVVAGGGRAMATIMKMHWPEVTKEQYEKVREIVNWEGDIPQGAKFHVM